MTHVSHEGATSGHSSRRGQGADQGPPHPSAHLPCVCLGRHTMGGRIASILAAHDATKFGNSIYSVCDSTF
jgi:hypothetical protein